MPRFRKYIPACGFHGCGVLVVLVVLTGCSTNRGTAHQPTAAEQIVPGAAGVMSTRDVSQLRRLAAERTPLTGSDGYRVGPDDLLSVRVQDLLDAATGVYPPKTAIVGAAVPDVEPAPTFQEGSRVSASGEITVPQIGIVQVAGLTTPEIETRLSKLLVAHEILRHPEVSVVVIEHRSHVVAVVGSVQRPGLYPLTRPGATLADLIWAAGGPTKDAGRLVQFVIGQPGVAGGALGLGTAATDAQVAANTVRADDTATVVDSGGDMGPVNANSAPLTGVSVGASAIRIDLDTLLSPANDNERAINIGVRPGDVINIPPAGSVFVDGWVYKPGSYLITRNLTLAGAVAAAGGCMYPAEDREATVRRVLRPGEERLYTVDLEAVAEGRETDLAILDGDVVYLPSQTWKLIPWGFWSLVNSLLRFGAAVPIA